MKRFLIVLLAFCCLLTSCHIAEDTTISSSSLETTETTETTQTSASSTEQTSTAQTTSEITTTSYIETTTSEFIDDDSHLWDRSFRDNDAFYRFEHQGGDRDNLLLTEVYYSGEVLFIPASFSDGRGTVELKEVYFATVFDTCIHTRRFVFKDGIEAILSATKVFPEYVWSTNAVEEIFIPASVSRIDPAALPPYLKKLQVSKNNPYYYVEEVDGVYYLYDQNDELIYQTKDKYGIY